MTTLIVGPFYLSNALGLNASSVGLVMSIGPGIAALSGMPAGRMVDRFGAQRMLVIGLVGMTCGSLLMTVLPMMFGIGGYIVPLVMITASYALFQAANNTAVMIDVGSQQRGVISGMLNLTRNLGLITGASRMGAVFAFSSARHLPASRPLTVASGMRTTFALGAVLMIVALVIVVASHRLYDVFSRAVRLRRSPGLPERIERFP